MRRKWAKFGALRTLLVQMGNTSQIGRETRINYLVGYKEYRICILWVTLD